VQRLLETFVDEDFVADLDFSTLRQIEGRFVDEAFAGREADAVWSVQFGGSPVYIFLLMEFQSTVDVGMPVRFLRYITGVYQSGTRGRVGGSRGRLPAVFPILIYNGERPWSAPRSFQEAVEPSIPARYIPAFHYYAIVVRDFDPQRLARMRGAVAAVFYAERLNRGQVSAHIDEIVAILKEEEPELMEMFHNWLAHAMGVTEELQSGDRRARTPGEARHMLSSTVDAYERKLKEAARKDALTNTAKRMLARGMAVEEVVAVTELAREEVEKLAGESRGQEGRDKEDG
jgi:predicted transposase/invertase (TIGR01784 family)